MSIYDDVVDAVSQFLRLKINEIKHGAIQSKNVEIEFRIGRICEFHSRSRIKLPVAAECVLKRASKSEAWEYAFNSVLSEMQARNLARFLAETFGLPVNVFGWTLQCARNEGAEAFYEIEYTRDVSSVYLVGERMQARVTVDPAANALVSYVSKRMLGVLNVYSGVDRDQMELEVLASDSGATLPAESSVLLDYRCAVSSELPINLKRFPLSEDFKPKGGVLKSSRQRERYSIPFNGLFRFDFTRVRVGRFTNYEFEIEMNTEALFQASHALTRSYVNELIGHVRTVISVLRVSTVESLRKPVEELSKFTNLVTAGFDEEELAQYRTLGVNVYPLIGGYFAQARLREYSSATLVI